jgi:hypothetical protein
MSRFADSISKREKRRGMLIFQLFFVSGFLALMWFGFGQNVLAPRERLDAPERLGSLGLVGGTEGPEALAQIGRLHGTDINLVDAFIAEYAHTDERLTVWVGRAESGDAAADLTKKMIEGIERGGSGFGSLQRLTIAGYEVFQVDGPGGRHFFYNSREPRERVVWLTIEAGDAMPLLEQAVKTF